MIRVVDQRDRFDRRIYTVLLPLSLRSSGACFVTCLRCRALQIGMHRRARAWYPRPRRIGGEPEIPDSGV
jgi:hypothetical protein